MYYIIFLYNEYMVTYMCNIHISVLSMELTQCSIIKTGAKCLLTLKPYIDKSY